MHSRPSKAIKALLVSSDIAIPCTHDLGFLLDLLAEHTISVPASLTDADWLTP
jgi:HEPN domain-containing protein